LSVIFLLAVLVSPAAFRTVTVKRWLAGGRGADDQVGPDRLIAVGCVLLRGESACSEIRAAGRSIG